MRYILILTISALLFAGGSVPLSARVAQQALSASTNMQPSRPELFHQVMAAHGVPADGQVLEATSSKAVRFSYFWPGSGQEVPDSFERLVVVDCNGSRFKRCRTAPKGVRKQVELFDGQSAYRYEIEGENSTGRFSQLEDSEYQAVKAGLMFFGLLPTISLLQNPATEVISLGTAEGLDIFSVKTDSGTWTLYTDQQEHLIRKAEKGQVTVLFGDYRKVEDLQLPFKQSLYLGGRQAFDLHFIDIELHPSFSADHFSRDSLQK